MYWLIHLNVTFEIYFEQFLMPPSFFSWQSLLGNTHLFTFSKTSQKKYISAGIIDTLVMYVCLLTMPVHKICNTG